LRIKKITVLAFYVVGELPELEKERTEYIDEQRN